MHKRYLIILKKKRLKQHKTIRALSLLERGILENVEMGKRRLLQWAKASLSCSFRNWHVKKSVLKEKERAAPNNYHTTPSCSHHALARFTRRRRGEHLGDTTFERAHKLFKRSPQSRALTLPYRGQGGWAWRWNNDSYFPKLPNWVSWIDETEFQEALVRPASKVKFSHAYQPMAAVCPKRLYVRAVSTEGCCIYMDSIPFKESLRLT